MTRCAEQSVAQRSSTDPREPLIVLLHHHDSSETEIIDFADHLPKYLTFASVCEPINPWGDNLRTFATKSSASLSNSSSGLARKNQLCASTAVIHRAPSVRPCAAAGRWALPCLT